MTATDDTASLAKALQSIPDTTPATTMTMSQGTVTAVSLATNPPTLSLTLSGSSTVIAAVQFLAPYQPTVGDTVQVIKQNNSILVLGATTPAIQSFPELTSAPSGAPIPVTGSPSTVSGGYSQGNIIMSTSGGTGAEWWAPFRGPGAYHNCNIPGGSDMGSSQYPFWYVDSVWTTVGAGSAWSYTSSGPTIHGAGIIQCAPGDGAAGGSDLGYLTLILANSGISGGVMTLGGAAFIGGSTAGVVNGDSIRINILALCW